MPPSYRRIMAPWDGSVPAGDLQHPSSCTPILHDYLGNVLKSNSLPIVFIPRVFIDVMSELTRCNAWKSPTVRSCGPPIAKLFARCGCGLDNSPLFAIGCPMLLPIPGLWCTCGWRFMFGDGLRFMLFMFCIWGFMPGNGDIGAWECCGCCPLIPPDVFNELGGA